MNALRQLIVRLYDEFVPPVRIHEFKEREEVSGWSLEDIAEYNVELAAWLDRKERERAMVRRTIRAEQDIMRRGR
jgi:flagellar biosynthesis/type III secretory pathway chaperone